MTTDDLAARSARALDRLREVRPLVHHLTNLVVMSDTANVTLLIGASPVMAHAADEIDEMVAQAQAVVLNLGTLDDAWIAAMRQAGRRAHALDVPVVLDPVGAGATRLRTRTSLALIRDLRPAVVRGNAGEIGTLAGSGGSVRGVDGIAGPDHPEQVVRRAARDWGTVVVLTGPRDFVSDGERVVTVDNGHPWLAWITGSGCMVTALVAAFRAVEADGVVASAAALAAFGIAAERAATAADGPGTLRVKLFDELFHSSGERLAAAARFGSA